MEQQITLTEFARDILQGLSSENKYLSSKYFYDDEGSRIFQDIMRMPEYYLTDCELEIFETQKQDIYEAFRVNGSHFELVELGAGDGLKTKILLSHFLQQKANFEYMPVDISNDVIVNLVSELKKELPKLETNGKVGDYFKLLGEINKKDNTPKILLFLGSNIGNFNEEKAISFLRQLREVMHQNDKLFIGFDLKKDENIILKAYNDPHGHTAAFNLNLLLRINKELNANFVLEDFQHIETYNPKTGTAKSHLISLRKQEVFIRNLGEGISFEKGEPIYMEMSQKYDEEMINHLAKVSGFELVRNFFDSRQYYTNSLWKVK